MQVCAGSRFLPDENRMVNRYVITWADAEGEFVEYRPSLDAARKLSDARRLKGAHAVGITEQLLSPQEPGDSRTRYVWIDQRHWYEFDGTYAKDNVWPPEKNQ